MTRCCAALVACCFGLACESAATRAAPSDAPPTGLVAWTLDDSTFDRTADPCTDLYQYACGGWQASTVIPPGRDRVSWARSRVDAANARVFRYLLEGSGTAEPEVIRLRSYYRTCIATATLDNTQLAGPIVGLLEAVRAAQSVDAIVRDLHLVGVDVFFRYGGVPHPTDLSAHYGELRQGVVVLGATRDELMADIADRLLRSGVDHSIANADAAAVADLELRLAEHALPFAADEYPSAQTEHPMLTTEVAALAPTLDWPAYFDMVGASPSRPLNVKAPKYLEQLSATLASTPRATVAAYARWKLMRAFAQDMPAAGASPETCRLSTMRGLGVELSRQFSKRTLSSDARESGERMAANIQRRIAQSVATTSWLSAAAAQRTAAKLKATDLKLGFPDVWPPTGTFALSTSSHLENVIATRRYEQRRRWNRANEPRSRDAWEMLVRPNEAWGMAAARLTIVNGYPDQFTNSIILPAASLQPPLFDASAPPEVNFATFGVLVGHELGHVADNYLYNAEGQALRIWSPEDVAAQSEQWECIVKHATSAGLDGDLLKEESTADVTGLRFAYDAMAAGVGKRLHRDGPDGLTAAQRFFLAYGQRWCELETPEVAAGRSKHDYHPPVWFRVNALPSVMREFSDAFSCPAPVRTCEGW